MGVPGDPFLERILELSPGIVFAADRALTITFVNPAATEMLGYDREEVLGRSVLDFLDTDWNPEAFASYRELLGGTAEVAAFDPTEKVSGPRLRIFQIVK